MFSSSRIASCFKSFLIYVSSSTQLLVNLLNQKKSHLLVSHKQRHKKHNTNDSNVNKVYIVIYLLLSVISISNCAAHVDTSSSTPQEFNLDEIGAIFHKVAYPTSTTTTKRSITDNVYVPSITTVPTPSLTTFRYVSRRIFCVLQKKKNYAFILLCGLCTLSLENPANEFFLLLNIHSGWIKCCVLFSSLAFLENFSEKQLNSNEEWRKRSKNVKMYKKPNRVRERTERC